MNAHFARQRLEVFKRRVEQRKAVHGRKGLRRRPPKWLHPDGVEREYRKILLELVDELNLVTQRLVVQQLPSILREAQMLRPTTDDVRDDGWASRLKQVYEALTAMFKVSATRVEPLTKVIASKTSKFNKQQFERIVRNTLGVDVFTSEPNLVDELEAWATGNVQLITAMSDAHKSKIENIVNTGVRQGERAETLAKMIEAQVGVTKRRARLIARDQVGKLNGQLTMQRQQEAGINKYVWRTAKDSRVRDEHAERESKTFLWSHPPADGHPGEAINCRCYAEPDLDEYFK